MNMNDFNWNDLKFFHAVAHQGSLSKAAAALGSSQPTVGRRIAALEADLGMPLFRRDGRGYVMTEAGIRLLDTASEMEALSWRIGRDARVNAIPLRGLVRVSAPEGFAVEWLARHLGDFRRANPELSIAVVAEAAVADVERLAADVAIRLFRPNLPSVVSIDVGAFRNGLYAGAAYLESHGHPRRISDLESCDWITFDDDLMRLPEARWMAKRTAERAPALRSNSGLVQRAAAVANLGIAMLPEYLGKGHRGLIRILPRVALPSRRFWLVAHEEVARANRVQVFLTFLRGAFADDQRSGASRRG